MPTRRPSAHRRRHNPDPQTLREYLHQHIVNLLIQYGAEVDFDPTLDFCEVFYPDQGAAFDLNFDHFGTLTAVPRPRSSRDEIEHMVRSLASVADRAGVSVNVIVKGRIENARLMHPTSTGTTRVIVPAVLKNKQEVVDAARKSIESFLRGTPLGTAGDTLTRALAESQPMLAAVPRKYRKQVVEMLRQAFENDDLAAYEHAQHLAELVSE